MSESPNKKNASIPTTEHIEAARFKPPPRGPKGRSMRIPWWRGIGLGILFATAWLAWFVVTARSVGISVEPANATVNVRQWLAPNIGNHWLLRPGPRAVSISAPGYRSFEGDLLVSEAQLQTHEVTLKPLPGHLTLQVTPDLVAKISIDGDDLGEIKGTVRDIEAGNHEIIVSAPRYLPYETVLEIEGRGIEQALAVTLLPAWADIEISSQPAGAKVIVAGKVLGSTPLRTELIQGQRVLKLTLDGYKTWKRTLNVVAGQPLALAEIVLAKADGIIELSSEPSGANVTIDGKFKGQTPLRLVLTPDAKHQLIVLKEGYTASDETLSVKSNETRKLVLELAPEIGTLTFETAPEEAELLVDGVSHGNASQTLSLPAHAHEITIRARGYATYITTITPRKGVEKRFRVRLKSGQELQRSGALTAGRGGPNQGLISTSLGQQLKLFKGGEFEMGSSRGDAAHRANENLRNVRLRRPFYLAVKEVTNTDFRHFLANFDTPMIKGNEANGDTQPIVNITWATAVMYCNWLSRREGLPIFYQIKYAQVLGINPQAIGYRLPTEAEWAFAARIPPKGKPFVFPWGGKYPPRGKSGNYADQSASSIVGDTVKQYNDGFSVSAPVASFPANLNGIYDMGGNVAEWVHDYYAALLNAAGSSNDPLGPVRGEQHVIRGSSWAHGTATELRLTYRDYGNDPRDDLGFRLARYAQ